MDTTAEAGTSSDKLALGFYPGDLSHAAWPYAEPLLRKAWGKGLAIFYTPEQAEQLVYRGFMHLWVATTFTGEAKIAMLTEFVQYPLIRTLRIALVGGEDLAEAMKFLPTIEAFAAQSRCELVELGTLAPIAHMLKKSGYFVAGVVCMKHLRETH